MTTTTRKPTVKSSVTVLSAEETEKRVPAGAKQPADHKPKTAKPVKPTVTKVDGGMEITYTVKGSAKPDQDGSTFTVLVPTDALDDFELLSDLREVQDGEDPSYFPRMLRRLVGSDGYAVVMNGLRDPATGRVSMEDGVQFVQDTFEAIAPNS